MSIKGEIIADVTRTLAAMREGAGYTFEWAEVHTGVMLAEIATYPACFIEVGRETVNTGSHPTVIRTMPLTIHGVLKMSLSEGDDPTDAGCNAIADIHRALLADETRGQVARDTTPLFNEIEFPEDEIVYVIVGFEVIYETNRQEPSSLVN